MAWLTKILDIRNIARISAYAAHGDVTLRRVNLVYGQNGLGKTSIASILRSYGTGDASPITERRTLGQANPSAVSLLVAGNQKAQFNGQSWTATDNTVRVFDSTYVHENIFAGDTVEAKHRRNLYEVIVGATNVATAKRIAEIDAKTRSLSDEISKSEQQVLQTMHGPFDIESFLALQPAEPSAVTLAITKAENLLAAARQAGAVVSRPQLDVVVAPDIRREPLDLLHTTFEGLNAEAGKRLAEHLQHLGMNAEAWLAQGLNLTIEKGCPFCAQPLEGNQLVNAYRVHFSEAYRRHQQRLQQELDDVERRFGEPAINRLESVFSMNAGRADNWADLVDLQEVKDALPPVRAILELLRERLRRALSEKLRHPTTPIIIDAELRAAYAEAENLAGQLAAYNARVSSANTAIAEAKRGAATADVNALEAELRRLKNTLLRFKPETETLCARLAETRAEKRKLADEKEACKRQLSEMTEELLKTYQGAINKLLERFGATFRISGAKPQYAGGKASSNYKIQINNCHVDVASPPGTPGFRTLSGGDRSALAFAFFLAQIEADPDLANLLVVIDDPISSQDAFRANFTRQRLGELGRKAKQLIILSHDHGFLKRVYDVSDHATTKCLQCKYAPSNGVELDEWDINQAAMSTHSQDYFVLNGYANGGAVADALSVVRAVRPYLEGALRTRFPGEFTQTEWLADFIRKVEAASTGSPLARLHPDLDDLISVNDYTKEFHHDDGAPLQVPQLDEMELRTHIRLALKLAEGGPALP